MRITVLLTFFLVLPYVVHSQEVPRLKLPINVNRPGTNAIHPILSGDGSYMLYFSNDTNFGETDLLETRKRGNNQWSNPDPFRDELNNPRLNHHHSIFITYQNDEVYYSTRKSPTIGRYDIYRASFRDGSSDNGTNVGKPVNSEGNEGSPSLTRDGSTMYFMRCEQMENNSENGCELYVSERRNREIWGEPEKLPVNINTGDTRNPLILQDNVSLIFASDRPGGKGGMDLYLSRKSGKIWSDPVPLDFLNTNDDDLYVSVPLPGEVAYYATKDENGSNSLFMVRLPEQLQPLDIMNVKGHVFDEGNNPVKAVIQAIDTETGEVLYHTSSDEANGSFEIYLNEDHTYDFSIFPQDMSHSYYSVILPLDNMERSERMFLDFRTKDLESGMIMPLNGISFVENTSELESSSETEINRLLLLLKNNPDVDIEIGVFQRGYREDTLTSEELTEIRIDTTIVSKVVEVPDTVMRRNDLDKIDSLLQEINAMKQDSLLQVKADSLKKSILTYTTSYRKDTITVESITKYYHNDRTPKMAENILAALIEKGMPEERASAMGYREEYWEGVEKLLADRKFIVMVRIN